MSANSEAEHLPGKIFGIDIGGTGIKGGIVDIEKGVLLTEAAKIPTPQPSTPEAILTILRELVHKFNWDGPIGCGFPAIVKNGIPKSAANISKEWIGYNALAALEKMTSHPVNIINDADAAGLAEMWFGAGRAYNCPGGGVVMIITLGTGIGSAIFVEGILLPNTELGHIEIDGIEAEKNAATVVRERNAWTWEEWSQHVNRYLQTIEFLFSPDTIIIGGGVSESYEKFFHHLKIEARLVPAQMANEAGIIGAALGVKLKKL